MPIPSPTPSPISRLRGLELLRGFVAVGRRMSVTRAADDLCVTQPAVSRQIRDLESRLGVRLFHRGHRSLHFTPEGERLFLVADVHLQALQAAMESLMPPRAAASPRATLPPRAAR